MRRRNGRSDGRSLRAQALFAGLLVVAGPTAASVIAEEIVGAGAIVALHVSRPRQALLGPQRFAFVDDSGVPIVGPGATVGTVETRVPRAGLPGPATIPEKISLRTRLSKPGEVFMPGEISTGIPSRGDHAKGLARPPATPRKTPRQRRSVSPTERTWALRPLQSPRHAKAG